MTALETIPALWNSCLHSPHEDAPWLVLADVLDEGDASDRDRCELIRASVELERIKGQQVEYDDGTTWDNEGI